MTRRLKWQLRRMRCRRWWLYQWYDFRDADSGLRYPRLVIFWAMRPRVFLFYLRSVEGWKRGEMTIEL